MITIEPKFNDDVIDPNYILNKVSLKIEELLKEKNIINCNLYWNLKNKQLEYQNSVNSILVGEFDLKYHSKKELLNKIEIDFNDNLQDYFSQKISFSKTIMDIILMNNYSYRMYSIEDYLEMDHLSLTNYYHIYRTNGLEYNNIWLYLPNYINTNFDPIKHSKSKYISLMFLCCYFSDYDNYIIHDSIKIKDLFYSIKDNEDFYNQCFFYSKLDKEITSFRDLNLDRFISKTSLDELIELKDIIYEFNDSLILKQIYSTLLKKSLEKSKKYYIKNIFYKIKIRKIIKKLNL